MYCCVYSEKIPDDEQRNCPKRVEFYSKNKFEKSMHHVGFIVRIYHGALSPELQKKKSMRLSLCNVFQTSVNNNT